MRTVGQILKETREGKFYSLEEVERSTKIQKRLLQHLENDDYAKLPPATFTQGFIKNYAKFLGLDAQKLLAIYRREFSTERHPPIIMDAFAKPIKTPIFSITPTRLLGLTIMILILTFFAYLWIQYKSLVGSPTLNLNYPPDQLTTDNPTVKVEGKTDSEVKVSVNSQEIGVDQEGNFQQDINLSSSENKLTIVATSKLGRKTEVTRTVYLKR